MPIDLWHDIRFAARLLIKDRWFTLAAATALALGIGANAAVFTFVNAVLMRGLPFREADRIMTVWTEDDRGRRMNTSELDYEDWRVQARSFSDLAATLGSTMNVSDEGRAPERVQGAYVTANLFRLIGQSPVMGRDFTDADDLPGAEPVVIGTLLTLGSAASSFAASNDIALESVARLANAVWIPTECPLCAAGVPIEDPAGFGAEPPGIDQV